MADIPLSRDVSASAMDRDSREDVARTSNENSFCSALAFREHRLFTNGANRHGTKWSRPLPRDPWSETGVQETRCRRTDGLRSRTEVEAGIGLKKAISYLTKPHTRSSKPEDAFKGAQRSFLPQPRLQPLSKCLCSDIVLSFAQYRPISWLAFAEAVIVRVNQCF